MSLRPSILLLALLAAPALAAAESAVPELPAITPGPPVTLVEALRSAAARNAGLQALRVEIDKAQAGLAVARALLWPRAQAGLQYSRADHSDQMDLAFPGTPGTAIVIRRQDELSGSLGVSLPLLAPQAWNAVATARHGERLAELSVEGVRRELLLGVAQAFYAAQTSRSLVGMYAEQVRAAAQQLEVARARSDSGAGLRLDVIRAETDLAQTRQSHRDALLALDTARDALAVLAGRSELLLPAGGLELPVPPLDEAGLLARARGERIDLEAKAEGVELADQRLTGSLSALLPTVSAAWQASYQLTEPAGMGSTDRSRWTGLLTLNVPLFDKVSLANIRSSRAALTQARLQEEDARVQADKQVRQALRSYRTAAAQVGLAEGRVRLAREGLQLAQAAFSAGAGSSLEVSEARRALVSAEVGLATAGLQARGSLAALQQSTGADLLGLLEAEGTAGALVPLPVPG